MIVESRRNSRVYEFVYFFLHKFIQATDWAETAVKGRRLG